MSILRKNSKLGIGFLFTASLLLILAAILQLITLKVSTVVATETCPVGEGWVKIEPLKELEYEFEVPDGYEVSQNCYKAGETVVFGTGNSIISNVFNNPGGVTCTAVGVPQGCNYQELSHASFLLTEIPSISITPPACEWTEWSECSAPCGGGIHDRYCGEERDYRDCNTHACETTPTPGTGECIIDGLDGFLSYIGNHLSTLPVIGGVWNLTDNSCADYAYLHVFGSMHLFPEGLGWLESQIHVTTIPVTVPEGNAHNAISEIFNNSEYCWYQVDLSPTSVILDPPYYNGANMIDYVFVKGTNPECEEGSNGGDTGGDGDPEVTPTPTLTPTLTPSPSPTTAPSQDTGGASSTTESDEETAKILGVTTLADTGSVADYYIVLGLVLTITSLYGFSKTQNKNKI